MPMFDVKCTNEKCGKVQERLLRNADEVKDVACTSCGSPVERQFTVGTLGFLFNYMES